MELELDRDGPVPIYRQIESWMRHKIQSGAWRENSQIPAEEELAVKLSVNRGTLRKSVASLIQSGHLERVHGKGTFVSRSHVEHPLADSFITFSESLLERNVPYETEVRSAQVVPADTRVASLLALEEGAQTFSLERIRRVNDEPVVLLKNHVVYAHCRGIERVEFERVRLFDALEKDFGLTIDWGQRTFQASSANSEEGRLLEIEPGSPVMYVQQVSHLEDNMPVELSDLWFRGDQFRLSARVKRLQHTGGLREILVKS